MTTDMIKERLLNAIDKCGFALQYIADRIEVKQSILFRFFYGNGRLPLNVLANMCVLMDIDANSILK